MGTFECTRKGYEERETSFTLLKKEGSTYSGIALLARERERGTHSGLALLAPQKWWFFGTFGCTGMGYVGRELLSLEGGTYSGLALLASQKWCFLALLGAPVRGM